MMENSTRIGYSANPTTAGFIEEFVGPPDANGFYLGSYFVPVKRFHVVDEQSTAETGRAIALCGTKLEAETLCEATLPKEDYDPCWFDICAKCGKKLSGWEDFIEYVKNEFED